MGVEVEVRSQLTKLVQDLENIKKASDQVGQALKRTGEEVGKSVDDQTKRVKTTLEVAQEYGRKVAQNIRQDFMALGSIGALTGGLSLANQFKGSMTEAITLSDTIRRLGHVFGIAKSDFASFQSALQKGFGDIGMSSEAAANAIQGLSETPVRGQKTVQDYALSASKLASISGEKGSEGAVARGIVSVIQARGGNVASDQDRARAEKEILQIQTATGKKASEVTAALADLYSKTNADFKKQMQSGAGVTLAAAALKGGPGATSFLERFVSMNANERVGSQAQLGNIIGPNGQLNKGQIAADIAEANRRTPGNTEAGLRSMALSADEAKGFMRLADAVRDSGDEINAASQRIVDLDATFKECMGAADAFRASLNRVKAMFSDITAGITQHGTTALEAASESGGGALAVTGGAALLSAALTGKALAGIGARMGLQGALGGLTGAAGAGGTLALGAFGVLGAGAAGYGLGTAANYGIDRLTQGTTSDGFKGNAIERLIFKLDQLVGGTAAQQIVKAEVKITEAPKQFKATPMPGRGH